MPKIGVVCGLWSLKVIDYIVIAGIRDTLVSIEMLAIDE